MNGVKVGTISGGLRPRGRSKGTLDLLRRLALTFSSLASFVSKVLSKGHIVYAKHQLRSRGGVYTSTIIDVTSEMLPSFRILAFYLLPRGTGRDPELVADSIWIDMNDRCMGTVS